MSLNDKENLCNNLIYFRKKNKLTQLQLSEKLGYSNKNISKWENGEIVPDIFMLNKLALIYGITVDEFLNGEKEDIDAKLAEEIVKNNKMKKRIIFQSFLIFCCVIATACVIISTTIFSSPQINKYSCLVYFYGGVICFLSQYIYFKYIGKRAIISIVFLCCFLLSLSLAIYYSIHCSPWLFLINIPLGFLIYSYSELITLITKYKKRKR